MSVTERSVPMKALAPLIQEGVSQGQDICFSPKGISMLPMLRQGKDTVVLSAVKGPLKKYDIPLYQRDDGTYVLHRIVAVGKTYTCIGDNQYTLEAGIRPDQVIAVVTAFYRGNRKIPVTRLTYRGYCCLWHRSRPVRRFFGRVRRKLGKILGGIIGRRS